MCSNSERREEQKACHLGAKRGQQCHHRDGKVEKLKIVLGWCPPSPPRYYKAYLNYYPPPLLKKVGNFLVVIGVIFGGYSPLTRIRGTTLENFGAKSSFFRRVGFQKACENCPPDFSGQRSRSSGEQNCQKRRYFSSSMQDLRIFKNALLKSAPYS